MSTMPTRAYWLHALTPLHVGVGRGIGFIDLPIMREKVTNWPLVPGSAVKGVIADHCNATAEEREGKPELEAAFGRAGNEDANAGALVFSDARLVCLPARSLYGTFAWATSPLALRRLLRDLQAAGSGDGLDANLTVGKDQVLLPDADSVLKDSEGKVLFEELDFESAACPEVASWADVLGAAVFGKDSPWATEFRKRFAVLHDDRFSFLCEFATEVTARVRIEAERKKVKDGALWYEEALPAEAILCGLVFCDRIFHSVARAAGLTPDKLMKTYCDNALDLQMGGKATVGRGRVRAVFGGGAS